MITYEQWTARFPEFLVIPKPRFEIFFGDSQIEMGKDEGRWLNVYDVAQANLIAHYITIAERSAKGESAPALPVRAKEVDEVSVEYGLSREQTNSFDALNSTVYGQSYIRWRRQVFAGPRVVGYT